MTKAALLGSVALIASACQAGWESWLKDDLYRASFESYDVGDELSNEGTYHGTWGIPAVPAGAEANAASDTGSEKYIKFFTEGQGLVFTPDNTGNRSLKSVLTSAQLSAYDENLPDLSDLAPRGAFAIHAPANGATNFVGWTTNGWVSLRAPSVAPEPKQWYDVSMKFVQDAGGFVAVQYRLRRHEDVDAEYETLHDVNDEEKVWFEAGEGASGEVVSKVEFRGEGGFSRLVGSEPRRGLLIGLVPWRQMLIDESVYHHGSGEWYVFDYVAERRRDYPVVVDSGDAYGINVPEGEDYAGFKAKEQGTGSRQVIEFAVRFMAPNDNDAMPTNDVCALVRLVEMPLSDVKKPDLDYRFACLANGSWHVSTGDLGIKADVNADYTVEVTLDRNRQTVSYRIKAGRGAEAGAYRDMLMDSPVSIGDPIFTFFGGAGTVYSIKSSDQSEE